CAAPVHARVLGGGGGWYIGGDFTRVISTAGGVTVDKSLHNAAQIKGDGSIGNWNPNSDLPVRAIPVLPGATKRIAIGGDFTNVHGVTVGGLAVTTTTGAVDAT